jgi:pyruvate/2-oxoglutarate dehydrogenase complex dihydrolipoamide acyltransferase (E2) component
VWAARFIGANRRYRAPRNDFERKKKNETTEVITLSLTFDHCVVNGAGAANFVHEIKEQIEKFKIPVRETRTIGR